MMKFDGFLPGAVLVILVVTVLFALYGDNFVTRSSTSAAMQADVPVQTMFGAPPQAQQGGPQFVTIANPAGTGLDGIAMEQGRSAMVAPPGNDFAPEAPPNFIPKKLAVDEAHWMGMDVRRLDHEMRVKLRYPAGLHGMLVGQVSMESSMSGLLGGDVITQVNNIPVATLEEFQAATKTVKDLKEASMTVLRKTNVID